MKINYLIILIIFLLISCRGKSREMNETVAHSDKSVAINELIIDTETYTVVDAKTFYARINTDCEYSIYPVSSSPSGILREGKEVLLTGKFNPREIDDVFSVLVQVSTLDGEIIGYVNNSYLNHYNNFFSDLWFKDIMLTRYYYYSGSPEDIYNNDYLSLLDEGVDKDQSIRMMRHFFSENRLLISNNFLIKGNSAFTLAYHLFNAIYNENSYTLQFLDFYGNEFEIVLLVDNDSVTMTQFITKNSIDYQGFFMDSMNIKYIPFNIEKSEITRSAILEWCLEQIGVLSLQ